MCQFQHEQLASECMEYEMFLLLHQRLFSYLWTEEASLRGCWPDHHLHMQGNEQLILIIVMTETTVPIEFFVN